MVTEHPPSHLINPLATVRSRHFRSLRHWQSLGIMILLLVWPIMLSGCSEETGPAEETAVTTTPRGCRSCHQVEPDEHHRFACSVCHGGDDRAETPAAAHAGLIVQPAHPDHAAQTCGGCHASETAMVANNHHYTLTGHLQKIRGAFGITDGNDDALALFSSAVAENEQQLVDDLLRRRCLRCHVYYTGDEYSQTTRGVGCAACHLEPRSKTGKSHHFTRYPTDNRCLSCHYGNHVGFDYYGRFEHDFNQEYRTPYLRVSDEVPPYGVEYHELEADLHHRAGLVCIDCHGKEEIMGLGTGLHCVDCHDPNQYQPATAVIIRDGADTLFSSAATSLRLRIPAMRHPAHEQYAARAVCQACHARWTFNDGSTHLLRIDHDDFFEFFRLSVDGSSEVTRIIASHIDDDGEWLDPVMSDKFTGALLPGIWIKGYLERRWEEPLFTRDEQGRITPARPMLDLHLSWIDRSETVRFDNLRPVPGQSLLLPYTPHTTGPAGLFYEERLRFFEIGEFDADREN